MSPEAQRIAIAEACGWTEISDWGAGGINGKHPTEPWVEVIPAYLNDLNAMHEAEMMLKSEDCHTYGCYCSNLYEDFGNTVSLTARQRAEAFQKILAAWKGARNE